MYTYKEVENAADKLYSILVNPKIINACSYIYDGVIYKEIQTILIEAYIAEFPKNDPDMQLILEAYNNIHIRGQL